MTENREPDRRGGALRSTARNCAVAGGVLLAGAAFGPDGWVLTAMTTGGALLGIGAVLYLAALVRERNAATKSRGREARARNDRRSGTERTWDRREKLYDAPRSRRAVGDDDDFGDDEGIGTAVAGVAAAALLSNDPVSAGRDADSEQGDAACGPDDLSGCDWKEPAGPPPEDRPPTPSSSIGSIGSGYDPWESTSDHGGSDTHDSGDFDGGCGFD